MKKLIHRSLQNENIDLINAALVGVDFGKIDFDASLEELSLLAQSAGAHPAVTLTGRRSSPDAKMFVGSGKVEELRLACEANDVELVIFNHALAPAQQRNLETALDRRVIDRTSLILDIFAQRARSHEGKLQVELAQLTYLSTRLIRAWTHLERQKGGIGLRGPGETQLETDRRLIGERIKALKTRLGKTRRQHGNRPPPDRRAHQGAQDAARKTAAPARHPAARARAQSHDVGVAGRLYQRRQV